jgi:PII-like signaling protein
MGTTWLLRFYLHEGQRCHGMPSWEWLLAEANRMGVRGGSAFKAMAGFGRHHRLHEARFFELAGSLAVEVEFIVDDDEAARLVALVEAQKLRAVFAKVPAELGVIDPGGDGT